MALEADQVAAFVAGSGGLEPAQLWLAVAMIAMSLVLLWLAWVAFGHFRAWREGQADGFDLLWAVLRAAVWALVLGWVVTPP